MKPKLSSFKITHTSDFVLMVKANLCTAIYVYFTPDMKQEDIIAEIGAALTKVPNSESLIQAGDLNTRIDSQSNKTSPVLDYLQEEGLSVVNKASDKTYYCYNGSSAIDLLFVNDRLSAISQNILYNIVIRKHLPVETTLLLKKNGNTKQTHETKLTRKLDTEKRGRKRPFKALKPRNPKFPKNNPMQVWIEHLSTTTCGKETRPPAIYSTSENFQPITKQQIMEVIRTSKYQKAPGPDEICNEHLKAAAPTMIEAWVNLVGELV
ncbi:hypothetical protein ANN_28025 [Periplaneta americana]|uniref:Endonuclease/exonuclease/phosphatase domain-containing protein n=1 Tax=Periplaneta americana TaxID=6978 RepID=A0ABQ8RUQ9_PERAM|nr:hypothetical protein ANN_28025 [Periplaneta americana]